MKEETWNGKKNIKHIGIGITILNNMVDEFMYIDRRKITNDVVLILILNELNTYYKTKINSTL